MNDVMFNLIFIFSIFHISLLFLKVSEKLCLFISHYFLKHDIHIKPKSYKLELLGKLVV